MITGLKFNPITGNLDLISKTPELDTNPSSPKSEDAWVLKSSSTGGGTIKGFLALWSPILNVGSNGYSFSYRTKAGSTKVFTLS